MPLQQRRLPGFQPGLRSDSQIPVLRAPERIAPPSRLGFIGLFTGYLSDVVYCGVQAGHAPLDPQLARSTEGQS